MSDSETGACCGGRLWHEKLAWFIGETARPMSIGIISTATAWGFLTKLGVAELGIMSALVGTLYGAKVVEKVQQSRSDAQIKTNGNGDAK